MAKAKCYHTPVYLLLALALALLAGIPFMPQAAASPDQDTFYSRDSDGFLYVEGYNNYSAVHNASSGDVEDHFVWLEVGQQGIPGMANIEIRRGALFFDTSPLPDDASISSAVLSLHGDGDFSDADFEITVVDGSVLHEPLVGADYGALRSQNVSGGAFNTSGFNGDGWNDIPLNETGLGWISKTGITKLGLRSSRDIAAIAPSTSEYVCVYASQMGKEYEPRLAVTYMTSPTPPVSVGGEPYPVDKASILALWIGVCAVAIAGAIIVLRRRRAHS